MDAYDEIYDLPDKKSIMKAFAFKDRHVGRGNKARRKKKQYTYNQYISFKLKTPDNHTLLIEIIAHNSTVIGNEGSLREIAAEMCWRYGLLIQSYWNLIDFEN